MKTCVLREQTCCIITSPEKVNCTKLPASEQGLLSAQSVTGSQRPDFRCPRAPTITLLWSKQLCYFLSSDMLSCCHVNELVYLQHWRMSTVSLARSEECLETSVLSQIACSSGHLICRANVWRKVWPAPFHRVEHWISGKSNDLPGGNFPEDDLIIWRKFVF